MRHDLYAFICDLNSLPNEIHERQQQNLENEAYQKQGSVGAEMRAQEIEMPMLAQTVRTACEANG